MERYFFNSSAAKSTVECEVDLLIVSILVTLCYKGTCKLLKEEELTLEGGNIGAGDPGILAVTESHPK